MDTAQPQRGMIPAIQLSLPVVDFNDLLTMASHVFRRMVTSFTSFSGGQFGRVDAEVHVRVSEISADQLHFPAVHLVHRLSLSVQLPQ
jgi:hypothetical protein